MATGFSAGFVSWIFLDRKEGRGFSFCSDLLFWIMISGVAGARVAYVVSDLEFFLADPLSIVRVDQGGLIYYGGLFGAGLALVVFARAHHVRVRALLDFVITSVPLAHFFGRIGCFLNGCCFGRVYDGMFAVRYPAESLAWWHHVGAGRISRFRSESLPVHPVQLYEAGFTLILYFLMMWAFPRRKRDGRITALYLMAYPAGRFLLEMLRGDERMRWMGMTVAQVVSVLFFVAGAVLLVSSRTDRNEARSTT